MTEAANEWASHERKAVRKVEQIRLYVNDVLVTKVRRPDRGATVTLPAPDGERADVRAEVALASKHHGRRAQVLSTIATYEACS